MTLNTSDRKSVRAAEKAAERDERNRGEVVIALAGTEAGRKYIWDSLESAHLFAIPYPSDPHMAYFILGQRNQGQQLLDDILHWCPDQFLQMTREANGRRSEAKPELKIVENEEVEDADQTV
jgi:hypothetical protein